MTESPWTAIVREADGWWIGWIAEVPGVNAQARTREVLLGTLAEVLREAIEMNRQEAFARAAADAHAEPAYEKVAVAI